jgi:hypothetical protein
MTDFVSDEPNEFLSQLDGLSFDELLKAVIPAIAKRDNNLLEMISNFQPFSFSLHCLATEMSLQT